MLVRLRALSERLRGSLFFIPALSIIAALGLGWLTVRIDTDYQGALGDVPFVLETTVASARALLSTVAGATITVAGLVFSVTVVAIQLTSSQFSPRALRGYLRDRFQQTVIGIVIGTFTYALVVLAVTRSASPESSARNLSVTIALGLGILAALAIVAFIDRSTRALQASAIIRRISDETLELTHQLNGGGDTGTAHLVDGEAPTSPAKSIPSTARGWIQQIDEHEILRVMPSATSAKLEVRIGEYVSHGDPLLTIWADEVPEVLERQVNGAFALGRTRTMQQDIAFGLSQLVDIALRALSPGINDPTTAIEALVEIGVVVGEVLGSELPPRVVAGPEERKLYRPYDFDREAYVRNGFSQIRIAAADHPEVVETLIWQLSRLDRVLAVGRHTAAIEALRHEAQLAIDGMRAGKLLEDDVNVVEDLAVRLGLLEGTVDPTESRASTSGESRTTGGAEPGPAPDAAARVNSPPRNPAEGP